MPPTEYITLSEVKTILDQGTLENVNPKWEFSLISNQMHAPHIRGRSGYEDSSKLGSLWALYVPGLYYNVEVFNNPTHGKVVDLFLTNPQGDKLMSEIKNATDSVFEVSVAGMDSAEVVPVYQLGEVCAVIKDGRAYFYDKTAYTQFVEHETIAIDRLKEGPPIEYSSRDNFRSPSLPECQFESDSLNYLCFERQIQNTVTSNFTFPNFEYIFGGGGKAVVSFIVSKSGDITALHIKETSGSDIIDGEAIRVVNSLDLNIGPATLDGEPVNMIYDIPIRAKFQ